MTPTALDRIELGAWIEAYGRAWETGDDELMASLFTEDANYRSGPFREPFRGHDEIRAYARRTAATQRDKHVRMGRPFVDGSRVAVEWWTTMIDDAEAVTLPGCLLLRFAADGRCSELREYWHVEPGNREPFAVGVPRGARLNHNSDQRLPRCLGGADARRFRWLGRR